MTVLIHQNVKPDEETLNQDLQTGEIADPKSAGGPTIWKFTRDMFTKELLSDVTLLKNDEKIEADMMSDHSGSDSDPGADTLGNKDLVTVLPE